jgi:hypothetical protein
MQPRYLTKSRFKLASECPAKLFYTRKKEYANQMLDDSFLAAMADGGFMVGELAKRYFAGGHDITALDYDESLAQTNELLTQDTVVIYEAAIRAGDLFIRADVLEKIGNQINLYEVKAKSIDPRGGNSKFWGQRGGLSSKWKPYLLDVAFQKLVIERAFPHHHVTAHLMLADKSIACATEGLNQKFLVVTDEKGRKGVEVSESLTADDLTTPVLCRINVDTECDYLYKNYQGPAKRSFVDCVDFFAEQYRLDEKIMWPIGAFCKKCEFRTTDADEVAGRKSGRRECWKGQLGWSDDDFEDQTVLDIWNFRKAGKLIDSGCIKMADVTEEDIDPKPDDVLGISASQRRWMQVDKAQRGDMTAWCDRDALAAEMDSWAFPLHFIDFETTMVAIPFHTGRHPYEGVAFQFSHHVVLEDGTVEHRGEYINATPGEFPNYNFIRELKCQLDQDEGSIFRYAPHENTFLNHIHVQLSMDANPPEDRDALCEFIRLISHSSSRAEIPWIGERDMVDMFDLVKRYYYDPAMGGSNSLKYVLPAILNSSEYLRQKYSQPIYGAVDGIRSHNFKDWTWIQKDGDLLMDPYKLLPTIFPGLSNREIQLLEETPLLLESNELREGGAAMTAYGRMQFEKMSDTERQAIKQALLKYCELDTMAMVMIYEAWREMIR